VTVETVVGLLAGILALVFMFPYAQRALQGHFAASARSLGLQFDPRDSYSETQQAQLGDSLRLQYEGGMVEAELIPQTACFDFFGQLPIDCSAEDPDRLLTSLPTGPLPREPASVRADGSEARSNWTVTRNASYDDLR